MPTVLLVEDDEDVRESILDLIHAGLPKVRVLVAGDAEQAIRQLESFHVDGIVCDYQLPGASGLDVLRTAALRWPDAARLLVTGFAELDVPVRDVEAARLDAVVTKPMDAEAFLAQLRSCLHLRAQA
jgi:CheY-like chemotaxis protein